MNLTDDDVEEILRLLEKSPYSELKLTTDRFTLELKPGTAEKPQPGGTPGESDAMAAAAEPAAPLEVAAAIKSVAGETVEIYPPLPGTFYRAPGPGAEPFSEVGNIVEPDSVLGLVETMKMMNSIMAGCRGEVTEICAEDGKLVEVDDVLIRIRVTDNG